MIKQSGFWLICNTEASWISSLDKTEDALDVLDSLQKTTKTLNYRYGETKNLYGVKLNDDFHLEYTLDLVKILKKYGERAAKTYNKAINGDYDKHVDSLQCVNSIELTEMVLESPECFVD